MEVRAVVGILSVRAAVAEIGRIIAHCGSEELTIFRVLVYWK